MEYAELYARSNAMQKRDTAVVLREFVPRMTWSDDEFILDVGSGSGDVTHNLLLPVCPGSAKVVGIDRSEKMVKYARDNFQTEQLSFEQMDIVDEAQPVNVFPQKFTKIFSFFCLHWIKNQKKVVSNLYELLRPGGTCLLIFVAHFPIFDAYERIGKNKKWSPFTDDWENFVPVQRKSPNFATDFRATLEKSGFSILKCEIRDLNYVYGNLKNFLNGLKAANPFVHRMPEEIQNDYLNDCWMELQQKIPPVDGKIVLPYNLIVTFAQKQI